MEMMHNLFLFIIFLSSFQDVFATKTYNIFNQAVNKAIAFDSKAVIPVECEHLPDDTDIKVCRYRDEGLFPIEYWNWKAGHGCYWYLRPTWFKRKIYDNYAQELKVGNFVYIIPYGKTHDGKNIGFDYEDPEYVKLIEESFASEVYFLKWKTCAENAKTCCQIAMDREQICPNSSFFCPTTWDAWSCFLAERTDSVSEYPCPDLVSSSTSTPCILYSQKECYSNGTWNPQTDYEICATAPVYRRRHSFHVIVLYVSIALSFPAVVIFIGFKRLRILRVNLHRNLLIVCIIRNILTVMSKELVILDSLKPGNETNDVLTNNGVPCRILAYFTSVSNNAIYACMLMDGFYLHKLIVRIFSDDPNIYIMYVVTAVFSLLPTTIWAILLAIEADENCWMADSSWYQWIPDGFRIAILAINIILLLDIIRALLCKLRKNISAQHTKSTLKAMGFLIPLFGVPFIITANRNIVDNDSCTAGDIFYYVSYSIQALQGIMVALLFCYANKEVHTQIRSACQKVNFQYQAKFGSGNVSRRPDRRETAATYVNNNSVVPICNNHKNEDVQDPNDRVNDWLTQKKLSADQGVSPLEPTRNVENATGSIQNSNEESNGKSPTEEDNDKTEYFNRISKFIDDSFESLNVLDAQANR